MTDSTAYMITDMLRSVVTSGTGTSANVGSLDVAGKTGTTNYSSKQLAQYKIPESATRDSWFAGYTPQYTMAVWTGYMKDGKDEYISSKNTKIAQLIFKEMMSEMATDKSRFKMPSSVIQEGSELRIKGEKRDSSPNTSVPDTTEQPKQDQQQKLKKRKARRIKETRRTEKQEEQKKQEELKKQEEQKKLEEQKKQEEQNNGNGQERHLQQITEEVKEIRHLQQIMEEVKEMRHLQQIMEEVKEIRHLQQIMEEVKEIRHLQQITEEVKEIQLHQRPHNQRLAVMQERPC